MPCVFLGRGIGPTRKREGLQRRDKSYGSRCLASDSAHSGADGLALSLALPLSVTFTCSGDLSSLACKTEMRPAPTTGPLGGSGEQFTESAGDQAGHLANAGQNLSVLSGLGVPTELLGILRERSGPWPRRRRRVFLNPTYFMLSKKISCFYCLWF